VAIKVLHGKITKHTDPLTMHWLRNDFTEWFLDYHK